MNPTTPPSDAPPVGVPLNGESVRLLMPGDVVRDGATECVFIRFDGPYFALCEQEGIGFSTVANQLTFVSRPTAQADKTAPEGLGAFCNACQAIPAHGYCNLAGCPQSAPSRMASDAPAEGVGASLAMLRRALQLHHDWHQSIGTVSFAADEGQTEPTEIDLSLEYSDSTLCALTIAALTQAAPADPVAGVGEAWRKRLADIHAGHHLADVYAGFPFPDASFKGDIGHALAAPSPDAGLVQELVGALDQAQRQGAGMVDAILSRDSNRMLAAANAFNVGYPGRSQALASSRQSGGV